MELKHRGKSSINGTKYKAIRFYLRSTYSFRKHLFYIQKKNIVAIKYICYAAEMQSTKLSLISNTMQSEISRLHV